MNKQTQRKKGLLGLAALALFLTMLFSFDMPKGWHAVGSQPKSYNMGTALGEGRDGKNCATIQSKDKKIRGFGTLSQSCDAEIYLGKRIKMSGYLKTENVEDYAGLWLRVDGRDEKKKEKMLGLDNMDKRNIKGNTAWTKYEIVMDVPKEAYRLVYGALLSKTGKVWIDDITFEIVDESVPTTNQYK